MCTYIYLGRHRRIVEWFKRVPRSTVTVRHCLFSGRSYVLVLGSGIINVFVMVVSQNFHSTEEENPKWQRAKSWVRDNSWSSATCFSLSNRKLLRIYSKSASGVISTLSFSHNLQACGVLRDLSSVRVMLSISYVTHDLLFNYELTPIENQLPL